MDRLELEEAVRVAALRELGVLDTPPESVFDGLVETAALVCGVPISLVSLIDADRQWFKANLGLAGTTETSREHAFCSVAIDDDDILEVPDTTRDPRFAGNPLVVGDPSIRFYAGAPLCLGDGSRVGTLCVIDRTPRELTPTQRSVLEHLAAAAVKLLEARRTAREFEVSEARFRALSGASPLGVFATDAIGACTYTNTRYREIFGLDETDALGGGWVRAVHPDDRAEVFLEWQRTAQLALDFDAEFRILHDDGSVRHVRALSRPVLAADGDVSSHVGSIEDVTERKAQELALRKSETLLNETGALAEIGGWELDLASGKLWWSDQTCRIHGLEPGYSPALDEALNSYAPEARPLMQGVLKRAIVQGQGWDVELPFSRADGERLCVRAVGRAEFKDGVPVRMLGTFQNITAQVSRRRALEESHERMILATESGRIGVWDWSVDRGTLDWTAQMYALFDLPDGPERVDGDLWADRVHLQDRDRLERVVRDALVGGEGLNAEFRIVHADGSVHYLCIAARVTRDAGGKALRMLGVCWDVTPLRSLGDKLAEQHQLLRVTLQSIGDAVITTDATGRVTWLNPAAERMTGWSSVEATGCPSAQVFLTIDEKTRQAAADSVAACLRLGTKVSQAEHTVLIARAGGEFSVESSVAPIRSERGEVFGAVLVFRDVSEQRRLSEDLSYRATHDALTGLVNRTELETRLERALERVGADRREHALMVIDLDQFKLVNDACGHSAGDELLRRVASLMADVMRSSDTLARTGGDEFAAILEDCRGGQAQKVAQAICDRLDNFRFVHDGRRFRIGASIGLVPLDERWKCATVAMQAADVACYAAKEAGRNRVHVWFDTDGSLRERERETRWATRLEQALDDGHFVLHAQRIGAVSERCDGVHAEVLIRLQESDGRLIRPGVFLPVAERFHLMTRIDRWVLHRVIEHLVTLVDPAVVMTLCVNVSGQSIGDREFHRDAIDALTRAGEEVCRRLCLEITETAAIGNMPDAIAFAEQVRDLGVRVALDDFGAGASSFGYLRSLPADVMKIDGRYIQGMIDDALDDAAVRCFVDVARLTGVKTVAEYVDRSEVLERVEAIGMDYVQGFLLHEPEPIENVIRPTESASA